MRLRYTDQEYNAVATAARAAGLTTTGYVADAALAAAHGGQPPNNGPWREALLELIEARTQLRRVGVNINQAARVLNATGEAPGWLEHAVALNDRAVARLDHAATSVASGIAHPRTPRDRPDGRRRREEGERATLMPVPTDLSEEE